MSTSLIASRLEFISDGTGVCKSKACGYAAYYQRGRAFRHREYRVWVPGLNTPETPWILHPDEFMRKFSIVEFYLHSKEGQ